MLFPVPFAHNSDWQASHRWPGTVVSAFSSCAPYAEMSDPQIHRTGTKIPSTASAILSDRRSDDERWPLPALFYPEGRWPPPGPV